VIRSSQVKQAACFYEDLGLHFTKHRHGNGREHYRQGADALLSAIPAGIASN